MATIAETFRVALRHHQAGELPAAEQIYRQILEVDPNHAEALHLLGIVAYQDGRHEVAVECFGRALTVEPHNAVFHNSLGTAYLALGKPSEAAANSRRALEIKPDYAEAHYNLANALKRQGKLGEAVAHYRRALAVQPDYAEAHNNLGNTLADQGNPSDAVACYRRALEIKPDYAEAHNNLGISLADQGKLDEAIASYQRALQISPDDAETHNNLGHVHKRQGNLEGATACYQRALQIRPDSAEVHGNLLLVEHYRSGVTPARLADAHAEWDRRHAASLKGCRQPFGNTREPDRPLRLGFVSSDLRRHPVAYFFVRCLEALRSERCETVCYSGAARKDDLTERIAAAAGTWRDVRGLPDEALAAQIRRDGIDVLFDLAGHTAGNRLLVFARKAAPVQVTWIGYAGTTGLPAIDYLFADRFHVPEGAEVHYPERVVRLPGIRFCYDPPDEAPPVGPLPALGAGHVTFGSFNNPAKITPEVVASWAEILRRVPNARLILKYRGLDDRGTSRRYLQMFADHKVAPAQIELRGWSAYAQMLAEYHEIDLALDPFPFCGAATSAEALWMGTPVVTCPLETFSSRQTLAILSSVGLTETVASDLSHYVDLAVGLARDLPHLANLRATLRNRLAISPLCDGPRFAAAFMEAVRGVWQEWCETDAATGKP